MFPNPSPNHVPSASVKQGSDPRVNSGVGAEWIFIDLLEQIAAACETAKMENGVDIESSCQKSRETLISMIGPLQKGLFGSLFSDSVYCRFSNVFLITPNAYW